MELELLWLEQLLKKLMLVGERLSLRIQVVEPQDTGRLPFLMLISDDISVITKAAN